MRAPISSSFSSRCFLAISWAARSKPSNARPVTRSTGPTYKVTNEKLSASPHRPATPVSQSKRWRRFSPASKRAVDATIATRPISAPSTVRPDQAEMKSCDTLSLRSGPLKNVSSGPGSSPCSASTLPAASVTTIACTSLSVA